MPAPAPAQAAGVYVVRGSWKKAANSAGVLPMVTLSEGVTHYSDRAHVWTEVPKGLLGASLTKNPSLAKSGLVLDVAVGAERFVSVLVAHGNRDMYVHGVGEFEELLQSLGFVRTVHAEMRTSSFNLPGVDEWRLEAGRERTFRLEVEEELEFNVAIHSLEVWEAPSSAPTREKRPRPSTSGVYVVRGAWSGGAAAGGALPMVELSEGVVHHSDGAHVWSGVPESLIGASMSQNPGVASSGLVLDVVVERVRTCRSTLPTAAMASPRLLAAGWPLLVCSLLAGPAAGWPRCCRSILRPLGCPSRSFDR
jgi:hypothetical protein